MNYKFFIFSLTIFFSTIKSSFLTNYYSMNNNKSFITQYELIKTEIYDLLIKEKDDELYDSHDRDEFYKYYKNIIKKAQDTYAQYIRGKDNNSENAKNDFLLDLENFISLFGTYEKDKTGKKNLFFKRHIIAPAFLQAFGDNNNELFNLLNNEQYSNKSKEFVMDAIAHKLLADLGAQKWEDTQKKYSPFFDKEYFLEIIFKMILNDQLEFIEDIENNKIKQENIKKLFNFLVFKNPQVFLKKIYFTYYQPNTTFSNNKKYFIQKYYFLYNLLFEEYIKAIISNKIALKENSDVPDDETDNEDNIFKKKKTKVYYSLMNLIAAIIDYHSNDKSNLQNIFDIIKKIFHINKNVNDINKIIFNNLFSIIKKHYNKKNIFENILKQKYNMNDQTIKNTIYFLREYNNDYSSFFEYIFSLEKREYLNNKIENNTNNILFEDTVECDSDSCLLTCEKIECPSCKTQYYECKKHDKDECEKKSKENLKECKKILKKCDKKFSIFIKNVKNFIKLLPNIESDEEYALLNEYLSDYTDISKADMDHLNNNETSLMYTYFAFTIIKKINNNEEIIFPLFLNKKKLLKFILYNIYYNKKDNINMENQASIKSLITFLIKEIDLFDNDYNYNFDLKTVIDNILSDIYNKYIINFHDYADQGDSLPNIIVCGLNKLAPIIKHINDIINNIINQNESEMNKLEKNTNIINFSNIIKETFLDSVSKKIIDSNHIQTIDIFDNFKKENKNSNKLFLYLFTYSLQNYEKNKNILLEGLESIDDEKQERSFVKKYFITITEIKIEEKNTLLKECFKLNCSQKGLYEHKIDPEHQKLIAKYKQIAIINNHFYKKKYYKPKEIV